MPFDLPMFVRRYWFPLAASALMLCGIAIRLVLTLIGWPHTNSEEGTMGLEAMHILLRGERPVYLYGQHYMGAGEAYLGAILFHLFGISIVSLRLGMVILYAIFIAGTFWMARLLYGRRVALASLGVLVVGTPFLTQIELLADGGKAETMAFGAMMLALASWLALSQPNGERSRRHRLLRASAFVAWGVFAGLGLYTYAIIAPFVLTSAVLLAITCRRELWGWTSVLPLIGLLVGLFPAIYYTATMPFADNPVSVFLSLHGSLNGGGASGWYLLVKQVDGTLLYTLPTATGLIELYPVEALPLYGPLGSATIAAVIIGSVWSLGYLSLLGLATYRPWHALRQRQIARRTGKHPDSVSPIDLGRDTSAAISMPGIARDQARNLARLMLALTAWLTIATYMFSATAANNPHSGRYMIGLLVIVPAILWPLMERQPSVKNSNAGSAIRSLRTVLRNAWRPAGIAILGASILLGAIGIVQAVPEAVTTDRKDTQFAQELLSHGITRFYSDYWTCDLMNFVTREELTCAVIGDYAQPGLTRYYSYYATVRATKNAPYVLSHGSSIERTFLIHAANSGQHYQVAYIFGRYYVYTPTPTEAHTATNAAIFAAKTGPPTIW